MTNTEVYGIDEFEGKVAEEINRIHEKRVGTVKVGKKITFKNKEEYDNVIDALNVLFYFYISHFPENANETLKYLDQWFVDYDGLEDDINVENKE